ncbi:peroxisomal coenzyme A diphosphatase NUDT7 isoform X1 [Fundulus heteroclitus]|uniref:peroxisomal coenzyme A diphosphatase NUDT7 isoform X1 n=2 Tax=Fundulus heteroclitus TaxID=8078 RepID=UPI00165A9629|nr:peroxisomal coenzyme A diphosphatase NUDT7 isoform X1 [Fundulus heteroclitus]
MFVVLQKSVRHFVRSRNVLMYGTTMLLKEEAVATLKRFDIGEKFSYLPALPKASVLIPLFVRAGRLHTLLTLRSQELRTSAGEVCFPGGKKDPSDQDDVETALREAQEEIGLPPDHVEVVCTLFPVISKQRGLLVSPVVGFIEETFNPTPNPSEVSAVFAVPLDFFIREKDHYATSGVAGVIGTLHSFYFRDPASGTQYHIWGLTAMLATLVAALALKKKPEFDVGFDFVDPLTFFKKLLHKKLSKL